MGAATASRIARRRGARLVAGDVPLTSTDLGPLTHTAMAAAHEPSTQSGQRSAVRMWLYFLSDFDSPHLPLFVNNVVFSRDGKALSASPIAPTCPPELQEQALCLFATYGVYVALLDPSTIATYISYIRSWYLMNTGFTLAGPSTPLPSSSSGGTPGANQRLRWVITGLKKLSKKRTMRKRPILLHQLARILSKVDSSLPSHLASMFTAALQLAFQALLRKSEYTETSSKPFLPETSLTLDDVRFVPDILNPTHLLFTLKKCKTDAHMSELPEIALPYDPSSPVNACAAMRKYILGLGPRTDAWAQTPLFTLEGRPLKGTTVHGMVQSIMGSLGENPSEFGTHSLRSGGATALADAGCPEVVLKTLGRWSSECYRIYARAAFSSVMAWGIRMASSDAVRNSLHLHVAR